MDKIIVKNTIFLYFRMLFTMLVTLYTSRVVLRELGVDDFGIYQVVGGVVGMLSFLNASLGAGTSRFLTFELGTGNFEKLKKTFSTTLSLHIIIAGVIFLLAETIGLWFVLNKLMIPAERMEAALWVYHFSILTAMVTITQVPYNASIVAHEKMNVYAYVSIAEVCVKLGLVFLLQLIDWDKLKLYAFLLCIVQVGIALFYRFYCVSCFKETKYNFILDKKIFKAVAGFSGWSLFASSSVALNEQGTAIITNMFFGPSVVTARALSIQVNMAVNQFILNFRKAVDPRIIKDYALRKYEESKHLLLSSTKYSFYLMFLLGFPVILLADPLLHLWLTEVPEYTIVFLRLIIVQSLFSVFDLSFYTALYAKGRLRENALISPMLGFMRFPIVYILFKSGFSPVVLSYAGIVTHALLGLVIKPLLISKIVDYDFKDILKVFGSCGKVVLFALPIPLLCFYFLGKSFREALFLLVISVLCTSISIYFAGIDRGIRHKIRSLIEERIR